MVFASDEEVALFLFEKIEKFQEKIVEIDNYCQLLQVFRTEYEQYRELQMENRL